MLTTDLLTHAAETVGRMHCKQARDVRVTSFQPCGPHGMIVFYEHDLRNLHGDVAVEYRVAYFTRSHTGALKLLWNQIAD